MYKIDMTGVEDIEKALKEYKGNAEEAINDVLHNQAGQLIQDSVRRLMPVSNVKPWKGKPKHAKEAKSLRQVNYNLAVKVTTASKYGYLYFPDDGTNTKNHVGEQYFFARGGEAVKDDIIDRCLKRLTQEL